MEIRDLENFRGLGEEGPELILVIFFRCFLEEGGLEVMGAMGAMGASGALGAWEGVNLRGGIITNFHDFLYQIPNLYVLTFLTKNHKNK